MAFDRKMNGPKISSKDGSTAIGGDVNAPVVNVSASDTANVSIHVDQKLARELPSFLGALIVIFSRQSLAEYGRGDRHPLKSEVAQKLEHNNLPPNNRLIAEYLKFVRVLEKSYLGVEQQNADARYLVKRKAGIVYRAHMNEACKTMPPPADTLNYVRAHAEEVLENVITQLLSDYKSSSDLKVESEIAHLAISLIVADAVVDCEVLERP